MEAMTASEDVATSISGQFLNPTSSDRRESRRLADFRQLFHAHARSTKLS
jgi:hypothetical protein